MPLLWALDCSTAILEEGFENVYNIPRIDQPCTLREDLEILDEFNTVQDI